MLLNVEKEGKADNEGFGHVKGGRKCFALKAEHSQKSINSGSRFTALFDKDEPGVSEEMNDDNHEDSSPSQTEEARSEGTQSTCSYDQQRLVLQCSTPINLRIVFGSLKYDGAAGFWYVDGADTYLGDMKVAS
ncbi:hypothetical protein Droror1_Dr00002325 [Drosera rotundifolia]